MIYVILYLLYLAMLKSPLKKSVQTCEVCDKSHLLQEPDSWHNSFSWRIHNSGLLCVYGHAKTSTLGVFGFSGVEQSLGRTLAGLIGRLWINTGWRSQTAQGRNEIQHLNQSMLAFKINTLAGKSILVRNTVHVKVPFVLTCKVWENNQTQLRELGKCLFWKIRLAAL